MVINNKKVKFSWHRLFRIRLSISRDLTRAAGTHEPDQGRATVSQHSDHQLYVTSEPITSSLSYHATLSRPIAVWLVTLQLQEVQPHGNWTRAKAVSPRERGKHFSHCHTHRARSVSPRSRQRPFYSHLPNHKSILSWSGAMTFSPFPQLPDQDK